MTPTFIAIQILNGVSLAMLLYLLASGLALITGLMGIVNLAQGSYFLLGAYSGMTLLKAITNNFVLAVVVGAIVGAALGVLMQRVFLYRFYKNDLAQVLLTFGFLFMFQDVALWVFPDLSRSATVLPAPGPLASSVRVLGITYPAYRLFLIGFGLVIALGLWLLIERTRLGAVIRAGVDDAEMLRAVGVNVPLLFTTVFALGAALAGVGGVVGAPFIGVYPGADLNVLLLAFVVLIVGGLGSLRAHCSGQRSALFSWFSCATSSVDCRLSAHAGYLFWASRMCSRCCSHRGVLSVSSRRDAGDDVQPLALDRVSIHFGGVHAVQDVSLSMQPGERRALIGPNGAGKTTLFNLVAGQLRPSSGRVVMFDRDVSRLRPDQRARLGLARTFQITNVFPNLSIEDNLLLALQAIKPMSMTMYRPITSYAELIERAEGMLHDWRLWDRRHALTRELSYGDQRELEILMALASAPRLLLLDEPTAGLSTAESKLVEQVVRNLPREITILFVEHDLDVAFELADRVTVMHLGQVLVEGTPDEIRRNARVGEIYVGSDLVEDVC